MSADLSQSNTETFGVFTEVGHTIGEDGYRSLVLYTSRGDSVYGRSISAYWNLTPQEAIALGTRLIEEAGCARGHDEATRRHPESARS